MSKRRQREREQRLNRTWRNPRYYVLLPVLPIAFVLAAPNILMFAVAKGAQWANDYLDERLTRLWSPLCNWVDKGDRNRKT